VGAFYFLFTAAVYHAVPWPAVADLAARHDVTAPGLLGHVLPAPLTVAITAGTALALIKDLPAMLLGVSRLMFAWGEDGIVPAAVARVHPARRTPHVAILLSALMATASIAGCFVAGDFFLGVDILVTAMLVTFLLMCLSVIRLPAANPTLAARVTVLPDRRIQLPVAVLGALVLAGFLALHTWRDFGIDRPWYLRSTWNWLLVMGLGTVVYLRETARLRRRGVDLGARMRELPPQ
jgi:basic amino acid/polyamine antiporter, APA family